LSYGAKTDLIKITKRILPSVLEKMALDLEEAAGQEVLWVGHLNQEGLIDEVNAVARGNEGAVPALFPFMEKGDIVLHNHPSGVLKPSGPDLAIASQLGNQGIGFAIVDNSLKNIHVVAEAVVSEEEKPLDSNHIQEVFSQGGALSRFLERYEPRMSQINLALGISRAYNEGSLFIGEAGTGVGKSFAYLLPSILWAQQNHQRIVISTGTINLQQQLLEKDIPLLQKILGPVKAVLVKGRRNYLCPHRLEEYRQEAEGELFSEEDPILEAILDWAGSTKNGSLSDLSFLPPDSVWSRINSDPDSCMGLKCTHREGCFVAKAKREAAGAQLLIVNHHLLFSDLSLRVSGAGFESTAVLPPFQRVVIDEAHNVESAATSYFSESFTRFSVQKHLSRLHRLKGRRSLGLLVDLQKMNGDPEVARKMLDEAKVVLEGAEALEGHLVLETQDDNYLYFSPAQSGPADSPVLGALLEFRNRLMTFVNLGVTFFESLAQEDQEDGKAQEYRNLLRRLEAIAALAGQFSEFREKPKEIFWIEKKFTSRGEAYFRFVKSPLEVGVLMKEALLEPFESVIFTSATLSIGQSFRYWESRVGIEDTGGRQRYAEIFPSPFDYKNRVLLGIPSDAPSPEHPEFELYLARFCLKSLYISEGRALVLFTSYRLLREVHQRLAPYLEERGIPVYKQGQDDRSRLLERFKREEKSVLFATDSFWEGVDVPGDALRLVIITRLPFRVPSEPVLKARVDAVNARGGNAFMELSLPEAVMKLKQGFGRLMRQTSDYGGVMILDNRVITKRYGGLFLDSLPETQRKIQDTRSLLEGLENFLYPGE